MLDQATPTATDDLTLTWHDLRLKPELLDEYDIVLPDGTVYDNPDDAFHKLLTQANAPRESVFYRITESQKVTLNKLFAMANEESIYMEVSADEIRDLALAADGQQITPDLLRFFPSKRRNELRGAIVRVAEAAPDDLVTTYPNGNAVFTNYINIKISETAAERFKEIQAWGSNGLTFNQLAVSSKDPLYIFPSYVFKNHANMHISVLHRQYVENCTFVFNGYCFPDSLARSLLGSTCVEAVLVDLTDAADQDYTEFLPYEG